MKTPPEKTEKKEDPKLVFQESSYPNLIDPEMEMRPPPYVPPLQFPLRREALMDEPRGLGGPTGTDHRGGGGQHWGLGRELGEIGVVKTLGTQSYLHPLFRRSLSEWDQLTQTESEPISTGPFP